MNEVGNGLRRVLDQLARSREQAAGRATALAALRHQLHSLTQGSQDSRVSEAQARLQTAIQHLRETAMLNMMAAAAIDAYLTALGVRTAPAGLPAATDIAEQEPLIDRVRRALPRGTSGSQTRGRWVASDGQVEDLHSGEGDEWNQKAREFAATFPPQLRAAARLAVHLEVKFAMRMREEGRTRESIVIDRTVCGQRPSDRTAPFTCDKFLKRFLPPGAELTVVEPDGTRRVYRGKSDE